ncbi:MAG: thioredoxin [Hyphomicrobium sp.]|jgi:zinc protease
MTASSVSDATFEQIVLQSAQPVLVDFWTEWCSPCKAMAPALDQVAEEMKGKVKIVKVDIEKNPIARETYGVRTIPTLILFRDGKPVARQVGGAEVQKVKLEARINAFLAVGSKTTFAERRATAFKLANGMDVVVIPDGQAPLLTHMLWYRVGEADAPQGGSGVANLLEHLMHGSFNNIAVGEFTKTVSARDFTSYHQSIAKDELEALMRMEACRMTQLQVTDDDVTTARVATQEQGSSNHPIVLLNEQMSATVYGSHPYGTPAKGWAHEIAKLSSEDVMRFYKRHYAPNNAILVVAGDVTQEEVKRLAEETYGKIPPILEVGRGSRPLEPQHVAAPRIVLEDRSMSEPICKRIYVVPSYVTAEPGEAAALELLAPILFGRIHSKLVEDKSAVGVMVTYSGSAIDFGDMVILIEANSAVDFEAVEVCVDVIVDDIRANGVSEVELESAKKELTADPNPIYDIASIGRLAQRYGTALAIGRSIEDVDGWPAALAKVTAEDIKRVANAYLDPRRSVTGWLLPEAVAVQDAQLMEAV